LLGLAAAAVPKKTSAPLVAVLQSLFDVSAKIIDGIMLFAPYAVACLVFSALATFGLDLVGALGWYIATVLLGLAVQMLVVYTASVRFLSSLSPLDFFRRIRTVMLTAFSTSSSNA